MSSLPSSPVISSWSHGLFALRGFANDITNPLIRAFKEIFPIEQPRPNVPSTMATPAALAIRKHSYKCGIPIGLALYAADALPTIPASVRMSFYIFNVGFYVPTVGLALLETGANPHILSMGSREAVTQRLNLAQAFTTRSA